MFEIQFFKSARKGLKRLDTTSKQRIMKAIYALREEPFPAGVKKLKGQSEELYRIRVGDYRIIYTVKDGELLILVLTIGHRRDVYRGV